MTMNDVCPIRFTLALIALAIVLSSTTLVAQTTRSEHIEGDIRAREAIFHATRAYPFDRIPQNARLNALRHVAARAKRFEGATLSASQWRPIGPFDLGGRVNALALHPTDGRTLWIGAADGGVWKSTDRGEQWTAVMDHENAIAVGAMAVAPTNPDLLYVGTGEATNNIDVYNGAGIMKSTDGGTTWRSSGLTNVAAFSRVVVHPTDGDIVFAAAIRNNGGFYRSSDGGRSWTRIMGDAVFDITINPVNPDELWIGAGVQGVMRSTDGGMTFALSGNGMGAPNRLFGRVSVQVAPSQPATLYALTSEFSFDKGPSSYIYKSTDGGDSWKVVLDNKPNLLNYYGYPQGQYNNVIAVKPDNPDVVVAGGVVLVRTTDGGNQWTVIEQAVHPDHHALAFDPTASSRLYIGNDGGMYRSEDAAASFLRISTGLAITQFYAMAIDQRQSDVTYGGTQDNGTVTNSATDYWTGGKGVIGGGDGFAVVVDTNSNFIYYEQPYGAIFRRRLEAGTTERFMNGIPGTDSAAWSAPLLNDPTNPSVLYHGRQRVFRAIDNAPWTPISPRFRTPVSAIGVSPVDPDIIYAGSGLAVGGNIFVNSGVPLGELKVSTDAGETWSDRTVGTGLPNRIITEILPSPSQKATAYIAYSGFYTGHIFKTTDAGQSWRDISSNLPDIPVNALAVHPDDAGIIYAGTDIGMFITTDGGESWSDYNSGLPRAAVVDLEIHRNRRVLRLATHGRSMWEIDLAPVALSPAIVVPKGGELWMGGTSHTISWNGFSGPVRVDYSLDDGGSWHPIAEEIAGTSLQWKVVDSPTTLARIRVTSRQNSAQSAVARTFTIERRRAGGILAATLKAVPCWGLAYDGAYLWATGERGDSLLKLDPVTLTTLAVVGMELEGNNNYLTDLTYNRRTGTFFLHDVTDAELDGSGTAWLYEVSPEGRMLHRWESPCAYPTGLVWIDDGTEGYLLASDLFGDQRLFVIAPSNGSVIRTINRPAPIELGPMGLADAGDGRNVWHVIDDFDPNTGPRGSTAVKLAIETLDAVCSTPLETSADSASAIGYQSWGKLVARGIERDPRDGTIWVTNIDGAIYRIIACDAVTSDAPGISPHNGSASATATLDGNVPNPFTTATSISFTLAAPSEVRLTVHDVQGTIVATPAQGMFPPGNHTVRFIPENLPAGFYRYTLRTEGNEIMSRTMVYVK